MASYSEIKERVKKYGLGEESESNSRSESYTKIKESVKNNGLSFKEIGVDGAYVESFLSDAQSFLSSAQDRYNTVEYGTAQGLYSDVNASYRDLFERYNNVRTWLNTNKSGIAEDEYNELSSALEYIKDSSFTVHNTFKDAKDYYGQWETEKDYQDALKYNEEQKEYREHDTADADNKITSYKELTELIDGADAANKALTAIPKSTGMSTSEYYALIQSMNGRAPSRGADPSNKATYDITTFNSSFDKLKKLYEAANNGKTTDDIDVLLSTYEKNLKKVQGQLSALGIDNLSEYERYNTQAKRVQKFDGLVNNAKGAEDFQYYAQVGGNIQNPEFGKAKLDDGAWLDNLINGREKINNIVTFSRDNEERLKKYGAMGNSSADVGLANSYLKYTYMTDDEVAIYNYYLGKGDTGSAGEYLAMLNDTLMQRKGQERADRIGDSKALALLFSVEAGIDQTFSRLKNLDNYFKGTEADATTDTQYAAGIIRDKLEGGWGTAYDVLNTTSAMLPSILVSAVPIVGKPLALATLGGSAIGGAYAEMRNLGYDADQAQSYATLVGASEMALQAILGGISKLGGKYSVNAALTKLTGKVDNALARVAITLGGNMASEGLEEAIQTALEPYFKAWTTGEDFEGAEWDEILYSALLGALSAGLIEGAPTIVGTAGSTISANRTAKEVFGDGSGLVADSLELGGDVGSLAEKYQQKRLDKGKELKGSQINRLVGKYDTQRMKSATEARLTALGEKGDVGKLADALVKQAQGESLTRAEQEILDASDYASRVANELDPENIQSGEYSTAWSEKIGTKRTNVAAYNKDIYDLAMQMAKGREEAENASVTKTLSEKESSIEGKYEVSKSGNTEYTQDGKSENVNVKKVVSVEGGLKVELEDGRTVSVGDLSLSAGDAIVYEMITKMNVSPETANVFLNAFKPTSVKQGAMYFSNVSLAYQYGKIGNEAGLKLINLPKDQKRLAYERGRKDAASEVKTEPKAKASTEGTEGKSGIIYENGFTYDESKASEIQKVSMAHIEVIDKLSNLEVHVFESKVENGKRVAYVNGKKVKAPNGYFTRGNQIYIDINAGNGGEGAMLYTVSHEITHYIRRWNKAGFKELADFLVAEYGKKGVPVNALIEAQKERIKNRYAEENKTLPGEAELFDMAYEEMVADAMSDMLADPKAYEKLMKLKQKNRGLWAKVGEAIKAILDKFKSMLGIYKTGDVPVAREAFEVRGFSREVYEKLQDLYLKAFVEADANYNAAEQTLSDNGIMLDSSTDSATIMSVRDVLDDAQRKKVSQALAARFGVTESEALQWLTAETSLASLILNPKYSQYLDYTPDPNEVAIKQNSDYPQGTVDFSPICAKRREFTSVMNNVLRVFPNHVFAATDLAKIRTIMQEEGMTIPCGICYVEDRRQLDTIVAQNFIDSLKLYREGSKTRPDGKAFNTNQLNGLKLTDGDTYTPSVYELVSLEGLNVLKEKNPKMAEAWVKFNNARGMQSVRLLANEAEYKRQILKYSKSTVKSKNDKGGLRVYSFSDAEMFHLIDIIQVITDSATVGLSLQGYTKVNEYAKAVKDTGEKLNRSLIPKGELGYHVEDGKVILDYDTVEGIDINHPDFFDNKDNPNVGNITIGINDIQIRAAMVSDFVDQIISFHTGQSEEVLGEKGISTWDNYKDFQTEKDIATGKVSEHQINIYTEVLQVLEKEGTPITKKSFVEKFLQVCRENNLTPRFSQFLNINEKGEYAYTEGYHKFLVDFKTFDQTTGEYLPQMPVKPFFDNGYITKILKDYVKTQKVKDAEIAKSMPKVIERITNEIIKPSDMMFSDRDSYAPTFYSHMGKVIDGIKLEKMGANGVVSFLKGRGVKDEEIKWSGIEAFLEGKKSVTKAELQEFVAASQLQIEETLRGGGASVTLERSSYGDDSWDVMRGGEIVDTYSWSEESGLYESDMTGGGFSTKDRILEYFKEKYGSGDTRWQKYTLNGGTNYRELVFKMPNSTFTNQAMRAHWGQDAEGILVHARIQDFDVDGKKMLFIEELQSDWHNEGAKDGYVESKDEARIEGLKAKAEDAFFKVEDYSTEVTGYAGEWEEIQKMEKGAKLLREYREAQGAYDNAMNEFVKKITDAPFRDTYHEYVLKRLLRMAAEEGYDSIGWTPSEVQTKRWSDEFAEGYRIEYDQDMPKFLRKYGKKWGATVGTSKLTDGTDIWSMDITDSMKDSVLNEGQVMYSDRSDVVDVNGKEYDHVIELDYKIFNKVRRRGSTYIDFIRKNLINKKITVYNSDGTSEVVEFAGENERVQKDGSNSFRRVLGELEQARNELKKLVILNAEETLEISQLALHNPQNSHQWLDANGWDERRSYVLAEDGMIYPVDLHIAKAKDGRNILYDANVKIKEGISIDKIATSLRSRKNARQAVKVPKPSHKGLYHKNDSLSIGEAEKFSDRDGEVVSNRTILAKALEDTVQNDIERNKLAQYKQKIALIESEQAKLAEIREKANALRFTKGRTPAETKEMRDLDFEANQIENRINTYDKQLLNLESTKALKNVLEREKKLLRRRLEQKGKDALKAQKQKDAQTIREIMTRNTESRKNAIEGRHKTEMRHKIKDIVSDLNKLLLNPTKEQHVPIGLQGVVADALDAINMDTMNAEERVAYYNDLIAKAKDPDEIAMLTKKRDFFEYRDMSFKEKITALKNAYAEFKESDDPLIRNAHNDAIEELIKNTADMVGNKSLKDMSLSQLEAVYDMYKALRATVRNANKMFKEGRQKTVTDNSESVKTEVRNLGRDQTRIRKITKWLRTQGWNMLKPIYAMKMIGSKTFEGLYANVRAGEDTWAVDVSEAKEFYAEKVKKYNYKKWNFKEQYSFKDGVGNDFSLSLEQIMSLYAYSKREQADKHLEVGGFVFDDVIEVVEKNKIGIPVKYEVNDANPYRLRKEDLATVIATLTEEQKGFIDEMQTYLSDVMGAKGNEVSLALYDIKLYKEKNYFPLKTAKHFREFDPEKNGTPKIKNSGFSKKIVPQADNPIVLSNFMDVWAKHVNDMSMYHAFVLPLEDFMRVYNYSSTAGGYDSVQQAIKNAFGAQANQYIETLMDDLNGGARVDPTAGIMNKMIGLSKKASVLASMSVVIQQPSALFRAMALVDAKYFVGKPHPARHKNTWAEVKKYAPVAIIKEMGYFDTGMGQSTVEWIKGDKSIKDRVDDGLSKLPALADEMTWCAIWKAVKRETLAKNKNLAPNSEEFLKKCGERFTEVVTETQVYDSVLARSGMMRSKDTGMKMATAFMAEPTTSLNMIVNAIVQGTRGNKKYTAKAISSVAVSIIVNSALVSLVYAARDDDEDETYTEKYLGSFTTELIDGFNPLTYIPFVKDIWSIFQGYDVERSDMSLISDLWQSFENLFGDGTAYEKVSGVAGALASVLGVPLKNILRDAEGVYNFIETVTSGTPTTKAGIKYSVSESAKDAIPLWGRLSENKSDSDKLYEAILSGDSNQIKRMKSRYDSQDKIEAAMKKGLRENDSRIKEAAEARYNGNIAEYKRIAKEIIAEGHFSQDIVVGAINAELSAIKKGESSDTGTDTEDGVSSIYKVSDANAAFERGDTTMALEVIEDLINTKVANGKTEKEAKASIKSSMTSYWKPLYIQAYQSRNSAEMERIRRILYASGLYDNGNEVVKTCQNWLKD